LLVDGEHRPLDEDAVTAAASFAASHRQTTRQSAGGNRDGRISVLGSASALNQRPAATDGVGTVRHARSTGAVTTPSSSRHPAGQLAGPLDLNAIALPSVGCPVCRSPVHDRLVVVGPLFVPGVSACRRCYLLRRAACSGYDDDFTPRATAASRGGPDAARLPLRRPRVAPCSAPLADDARSALPAVCTQSG
jgi:hypothetical protein